MLGELFEVAPEVAGVTLRAREDGSYRVRSGGELFSKAIRRAPEWNGNDNLNNFCTQRIVNWISAPIRCLLQAGMGDTSIGS